MKKLIYILFAVLLFSSCQTQKLNGTHDYTVKAGQHEMTGIRVKAIKQNHFVFTVQTNESWKWKVPEKNGFSKVTGIRWILNEGYENSARLVYIVKPGNTYEFWAYMYLKGTSPQEDKTLKKFLCNVEIGKAYSGKVGNVDGFLFVEVAGEHHSVKCSGEGLSFLLFPYIGGTYTIDHDWNVKLTYY